MEDRLRALFMLRKCDVLRRGDLYGCMNVFMTRMTDQDGISEQVRILIDTILRQSEFPGCDQLIEQASTLVVEGGPVTMLDLRSSPDLEAAAFAGGPIPVSTVVFDFSGVSVGELLVWVSAGRLSALEFAWWTDRRPSQLPHPSQLRVSQK